jgi:ankyrin repeat protein
MLTPLAVAVENQRPASLRALFAAGVDLKTGTDHSILIRAVGAPRNLEIVDLLLEHGADPDAQDAAGTTPLIEAVNFGAVANAELLLRKGANPNLPNLNGDTPLHRAVSRDFVMTKLLLENSANPNLKNKRGRTPLHYASGGPADDTNRLGPNGRLIPDPRVVKVLLAHQADPNVTDDDGVTPLYYAVSSHSEVVTELLLEAGAKITPRIRQLSPHASVARLLERYKAAQ